MALQMDTNVKASLDRGVAIPACPLALTAQRKLDERRQRALGRYYFAAGVGGIAVGVHTTQFAIRDPKIGLLEPVLELMADECNRAQAERDESVVRIAGTCGKTEQAVKEATLARDLGYHAVLLNLSALKDADDAAVAAHCRTVADVIPLVGFYLNPAIGGRILSYHFWRLFAEIENVAAIKVAPFDRYQSIDVIRAIAETGRDDIALYTGNDDNIVMDLLTPHRFRVGEKVVERRIVGGLLGHWAVWTKAAVEMLDACHAAIAAGDAASPEWLARSIEVTDCNAALFDAANNFAGCIPGLHEVLRRQGLLEGLWCLDPDQTLSPGQVEEIDRISAAYPHLTDDDFVREHKDEWLK